MAGWLSVAPYDWLIAQIALEQHKKLETKCSNHLHLYWLSKCPDQSICLYQVKTFSEEINSGYAN